MEKTSKPCIDILSLVLAPIHSVCRILSFRVLEFVGCRAQGFRS